MMRAITRTAGISTVLLAASMTAAPANALSVNRPLADQFTQQYNQEELQQLQAGDARAYSQPGPVRINAQPPGPPEVILPPPGLPQPAPPPYNAPPAWSYPSR